SDTTSVIDEAREAFGELLELENEIHKINNEISSRTHYESKDYHKLIDALSEKTERQHILGANNQDAIIEQTLVGLGFSRHDFSRATREFSGGWRMRIELAKILLQKPDVLLLDEPTNHLDIESIQWLEDYLLEYTGAVILISHDRTFLDRVTQRTIELSLGRAYDYKVPYSKFLSLRAERKEQQLAAYQNQQKLINDTERFIERFRYKNTKAVQVQSRIKMLDKLDRIEIDEIDGSSIHIKFPPAPRSGTIVVEADDLSKSFGSLMVLDKASIIIERSEKIAFVGKNGEGKTTFSRIIMGELDYTGDLKVGHNVKIGYYAQNQADLLDPKLTILETIDKVAVGSIRTKMRDILGAFLFSGEDVDKKVSVLSGGEKSRLALALMLLEPYNILLLDEPTNHLDLRSKQVLKDALLSYDGTLIVVSHDRDFLDGLATKIFEFKEKKIKEHTGNIFDFLRKKKLDNLKEIERKNQQSLRTGSIVNNSDNKQRYLEKKELEREKRKIETRIRRTEEKISELESKMEKLVEILANPDTINEDDDPFGEYGHLKDELEKEMEVWSILMTEQE
ncbi:MAG: ATP-binding cassette domain-containing protein, partial [Bacteroidales bacterium]|nr:ATP-binding cassette domain-containing protein [Bacteroidales bacterium]